MKFHIQNPPYISQSQIQTWTNLPKYNLAEHLNVDFSIFEKKDVIEIGCGPKGTINHILSQGRHIGINSFIEEYKKQQLLLELDHVQRLNQKAEDLEVPSETFDIALCFNALDHVNDLDWVLEQINRVLKPGGLFLINVHTFERYSTKLVSWILQKIDPTHPYHFSKKTILRRSEQVGFIIDLINLQPLGLNHGDILFRTAANLIFRTLWLKARK